MDDYKRYLAEQVISENKTVTYRSLSRGLKVHVNTAKQMLHEYHGLQNKKQPRSVHATYMLYGTRKTIQANGHTKSDEDVDMSSSPPEPSPLLEETPIMTLSLVPEESLKAVLSEYEQVKSIHVYSISSHAIKDIQLLADVSRPASDNRASDNANGEAWAFGTIQNPYAQRRERRGPAQKLALPAAKPAGSKAANAKSTPQSSIKTEAKVEAKPVSKESTPVSSGSQKPTAKRGAAGGIMQSFAKAASKPKKAGAPRQKTPPAADNSSMLALSDDGEDDTVAMPEPKKEGDIGRKSRQDRQEELKRMMEESSEEEEEEESEKEDTPMEEPEEEPPAPEAEAKEDNEPSELISSTNGGRRRGKRRVTKKKTIMDEQGYLVTVQEAGWESFSEDEPAPPSKKAAESASQPTKAKKPAPKGQGNIMSFFSKK